MNFVVILMVVGLAAFVAAETRYTDRYDSINIDEVIDNRKLLVPYLKCTLDQGRCTPEGRELRKNIQDAIMTSCAHCTDKQRRGARKVVKHIKENEPDYWKQITAKYDPEDLYSKNYDAFIASTD